MAALQFVEVPRYAALIVRRTYQDLSLPGALLDRAKEWLGPLGIDWNAQQHTWTFPSGAKIAFGYLEHEDDKLRYKSAEFQFVGFDELTEFSETQFRFLHGRLRQPSTGSLALIPLRMRGATNPGGKGHDWVKGRFIDSPEGRSFVPATLDDNPHIDRKSYEERLEQLLPHEYEQLRWGRWVKPEGGMFSREWFTQRQPFPPERTSFRVRMWDMAATPAKEGVDPDWTVGALVSRGEDGRLYIEDIVRVRKSSAEVEGVVRAAADRDGPEIPVYIEQEPGASGKSLISYYDRHILTDRRVHEFIPTGQKETRARLLAGKAYHGNVILCEVGWNVGAFLDEIEAFPRGAHDDQVDAVSAAAAIVLEKKRIRVR